jgi:proteasome lid subunit RPN8/RPN11
VTAVHIPDPIRKAVVAHARFCAPEEACGLLAVDDSGALRMAYCLTNVDRSASSYTVDPTEHYHALMHAERNGWSLGGSFHSHPRSGAVPSRTDVDRALEPGWLYLIVGLADPGRPEVRGWRITAGSADEVPLRSPQEAPCR